MNYNLETMVITIERFPAVRGQHVMFFHSNCGTYVVKTRRNGDTLDVLEYNRPAMYLKHETEEIIAFLNGFAAGRDLEFDQTTNTARIEY